MELKGEHRIAAPRDVVWEALFDPELLKECIKGCQRLEKVDDGRMTASVQAKVGPVKALFDADVEIVDPVAPERYTIRGEGKGGVAGFANGAADVTLTEDGGDTILSYHAKANVGGKLAQLGSRLVDTTAKKYAADFFSCLSQKLGGVAAPEAGAEASAAAEEPLRRTEPSAAIIDEGMAEARSAAELPIDSPHGEDTAEEQLEVEAAKGTWGGAFMWGLIIFALVVLILIALR